MLGMTSNAHAADRRLRVLVNAVAVRTGGGGTFVISQLAALAQRPDLDVTVFATGRVAQELERITGLTIRRPPRFGLPTRLLWEHVALARESRRFDVLYCTGNFVLPLAHVPQVVTMQNALHFGAAARRVRRSASLRRRIRLALEARLARASVRKAFAVSAVSDTLRAAIAEDTGTQRHVRTVPSATPVLPPPAPVAEPQPYVISVAHDHPHKDWDRLVAVFANNPDLPPLLAVGAFGRTRREQLSNGAATGRIRFRGVVDDRAELAGLYAGAACCVVHSRLESFGLTVLEALAAGVPVVASDIPAHREVCGRHAHLYDVGDMRDLADLLRETISHLPSSRKPPLDSSWTWDHNAERLASMLRGAAWEADSITARKRGKHDAAEY